MFITMAWWSSNHRIVVEVPLRQVIAIYDGLVNELDGYLIIVHCDSSQQVNIFNFSFSLSDGYCISHVTNHNTT